MLSWDQLSLVVNLPVALEKRLYCLEYEAVTTFRVKEFTKVHFL